MRQKQLVQRRWDTRTYIWPQAIEVRAKNNGTYIENVVIRMTRSSVCIRIAFIGHDTESRQLASIYCNFRRFYSTPLWF